MVSAVNLRGFGQSLWFYYLLSFGLSLCAVVVEANPAVTELYQVEGFRSARFGMNEQALRQAIAKDFPAQSAAVTRAVTPEKTTVLGLSLPYLQQSTLGSATVRYTLGYRSRTLTMVTVIWESSNVAALDDWRTTLLDYFAAYQFSRTESTDQPLPDGGRVYWLGVDGKGRVVALRGASAGQGGAMQLRLIYQATTKTPDIYRGSLIQKGAF